MPSAATERRAAGGGAQKQPGFELLPVRLDRAEGLLLFRSRRMVIGRRTEIAAAGEQQAVEIDPPAILPGMDQAGFPAMRLDGFLVGPGAVFPGGGDDGDQRFHPSKSPGRPDHR